MADNIYIFDIECFAYDWLIVFKSVDTGEYTCIWNDNDAVLSFMESNPFLGGFNNKHYDNHILKAIMCGFTPEQVKEINDLIIQEGINGWSIPGLKDYRVYFDSFDLMDDCQTGISLKSIEAHLGIPIEETEVDFNITHALSEEEKAQTTFYCKYDVDATEILFKLRKGYLENKAAVGAKRGLTDRQSMYMTNAKLTSVYLQAQKPDKPWTDEREYKYPDKLLRQYIPQEVFDFFDKLHDPDVPNYKLFGGYDEKGEHYSGASIAFNIGDCQCTIAYGGIHGAIPTYVEEATETRSIRNKDVASYYPHLMTIPLSEGQEYGFCSRCIPSPKVFVDTLEERVRAKRAGDKVTANALKLVLNTTYGTMLNGKDGEGFNDLYDPLMGHSVCITGQLLLLELSMHLVSECPTLKIIQLNTDGIMVSFDNCDEAKWEEITQEWQDRTGFELEEDFIQKIVQRDVNNYIEVPTDGGKPKCKGGVLVRGILTNANIDFTKMGLPTWDNMSGGAWNINNNAVIIARAVQDYFVKNIPPEETIAASDRMLDFQIISKVGSKYSGCYQLIDGVKTPMQKVNRVYATTDRKYGTLYKIHGQTHRDAKVPSLPTHCLVDNNNELSIDMIDRNWYLKLAKKHINEFLGIKPPKKNTRKINSLKKQALALFD